MSVSNQTNKIYGSGNGITTTFSFPFKIFDSSELYVYLIDIASGAVTGPLTLTTDYSVSISSVVEGGTVTFVVAPTSAQQYFIKRIVPNTQSAVIPSEGTLPGKQIENQLDLMTMMIIQANESVGRSVQSPITYTGAQLFLPSALTGYALGWDVNGNLVNIASSAIGGITIPIVTAGYVSGASLFNLSSILAGAGVIPIANIPSIPVANLPVGTSANQIVQLDSNARLPVVDARNLTNVPAPAANPYVKCSNTQASGGNGGTTTSGSYQTAVLNTKDNDSSSIASLSGNQITLPAGTYQVRGTMPLYKGSTVIAKIRLYNVTDSAVLVIGGCSNNGVADTIIHLPLMGQFTLSGSKSVALQYWVNNGLSSVGQGSPASFGDSEVYAQIEFIKVA